MTSKPVVSPEWDISSVLSRAEFAKAGLNGITGTSRAPGWGQAMFGYCDAALAGFDGAGSPFRADVREDDLRVYGGQVTVRFTTPAAARRAAERVIAERELCNPQYPAPEKPWTSTPVRHLQLGDASGSTWTLTSAPKSTQETTVLVRSGAFLSSITIQGPAGSLDHLDRDSLAASSVARLP